MSLILNIETSASVCSVCLAREGNIIASSEVIENANPASLLALMVEKLMQEQSIPLSSLDALAISAGPGSYTGLRIGAATAKGFSYALSKPLIAIDSLQSLAYGMFMNCPRSDMLFCPTVDARRMEIYYGIFSGNAIPVRVPINTLLNEDFLTEFAGEKILLGGSAIEKCRAIIKSDYVSYDEETLPSARWMTFLSEEKWKRKEFSDAASFEPNYIKPAYITERK